MLSYSLYMVFFKCNGFRWPLFFYLHQQFAVLLIIFLYTGHNSQNTGHTMELHVMIILVFRLFLSLQGFSIHLTILDHVVSLTVSIQVCGIDHLIGLLLGTTQPIYVYNKDLGIVHFRKCGLGKPSIFHVVFLTNHQTILHKFAAFQKKFYQIFSALLKFLRTRTAFELI